MTPASPSLWTDRVNGAGHEWLAAPTAPPPRPPAAPRPPAPEPPPRRRRRRLVAGVVALVFALAGAAFALTRGGEDAPQPATALPATSGATATTNINAIYAKAAPGVVQIRAGNGSGTGFVIDADGTIVTNAHVVGGASSVQVRFEDGKALVDATVSGTDPSSDLAVVKVDPADAPKLTPLALADSDDVRVGDAVVAIGYPLGLDRTATAGIVSGLGRQIEAPNGFSIDEVIQTDAPINPGNSGGPLLDARGRVIGVNSQIATAGAGGGNVGIGFSVPANTVRDVVPQLETGASIVRPYLGVSTSEDPGGGGARVESVTAGGPAADAGLANRDVITRVDGEAVSSPEDIAAAIADGAPGDRIRITVRRDGREQTLTATLARRP